MWSRSYSITSKEVTAAQMWQLFSDVNNWPSWDNSVAFSSLEGKFETGNHFMFQPKGGPKMKIGIHEAIENQGFTDCTRFPGALMYGVHSFEPTEDGLRITTTMKMKGILGFVWRKIVAEKIVASLKTDMEQQILTASKLQAA